MIALDTSAVVAIALGEEEMEAFDREIERRGAVVGAPTLLETGIVLARWMPGHEARFVERFVARSAVRVTAFEDRHALAALEAHRRYGKDRGHPAQLNFGDCLSYGVAKVEALPLLFKGRDFTFTDVDPALR